MKHDILNSKQDLHALIFDIADVTGMHIFTILKTLLKKRCFFRDKEDPTIYRPSKRWIKRGLFVPCSFEDALKLADEYRQAGYWDCCFLFILSEKGYEEIDWLFDKWNEEGEYAGEPGCFHCRSVGISESECPLCGGHYN